MNSLSTQRDVKRGVFSVVGRVVPALVLGAALVSCVAMKPRSAEEIVKQRSQARWDALVKGDVNAAYAVLSPGSRAVTTLASFTSSMRTGFWKSVVVEKVVCQGAEACEAHATIEYEFKGKRIKTPLRETWIREGTDWWYVQK